MRWGCLGQSSRDSLHCKPGRRFTLDTQLGLHGCLYSYRTLSQQAQFFAERSLVSLRYCPSGLQFENGGRSENSYRTAQLPERRCSPSVSPEEISGEVGTAVNKKGLLFTPSGWANQGRFVDLFHCTRTLEIIDSACVEELGGAHRSNRGSLKEWDHRH